MNSLTSQRTSPHGTRFWRRPPGAGTRGGGRGVAASLGALALVCGAAGTALAAPSPATAPHRSERPAAGTPAAGTPAFDFRDCPPLPDGVDRSRWRCEVTVGGGSMQLGRLTLPDIQPMTLTHAEGPMPDGTTGQVFGSVREQPTPLPGGLLPPGVPSGVPTPRLLQVDVRAQYAGYADFLSHGSSAGALDLTLALSGPLLPAGCSVGSDDDPLRLRLLRDGDGSPVSEDPPVVAIATYDHTLAVPRTHGCGAMGPLLDARFGLPAGSGAGSVSFSGYYSYVSYDQLTH